jgi:competence protein ComEC
MTLSATLSPSIRVGALPVREDLGPWFVRFPPIYAVAIAVACGDALGNFGVSIPFQVGAAFAVFALTLFLLGMRSVAVATALVAIIAVGTVPVHLMLTPPIDPISLRHFSEGAMVTVEGTLIREPEHFPDKMRLFVKTDRMSEDAEDLQPSHGTIRLTTLHPGPFRLGDRVRFQGRMRFPRNFGDPGEFDYEASMMRDRIDATMLAVKGKSPTLVEVLAHHRVFPGSALESVRTRIATFIDRNLDDPVASEMRALIIGDRGGIDERMHETFGRTGLSHLLVISGLHLSMVAAAVFGLVRLLMLLSPAIASRGWANKFAAVAGGLAVIAYASIAGHHVSTTRALIMVVAYMIAVIIDRAREGIASLALACIVICIAIPGSSADVGFELSFASVLTIILGMRRYTSWVERRRTERAGILASPGETAWEWMLGYVAVSFWAMLGVAPLTAYYFNQFSIVGLIANAIVVPIMGFGGTVIGLAACAMSFIWNPPAVALLVVAGKFIAAGNLLALWFADWPMAWVRVFTPTLLEIALAYGALFTWLLWPRRVQRRVTEKTFITRLGEFRPRWQHALAVAVVLAIIADSGFWIYRRNYDPDLRVTFLSVGEGDAAVVRFPGSRVMLIDGGSAWRDFDLGERVVARYLWSQKIMHVDWLALSHPDQDHYGGFDFLARNFSPHEFCDVASPNHDAAYEHLLATLYEMKVPIKRVDLTTPPMKVGGVDIVALNRRATDATKRNNASMVLRLQFGSTSFLFTGDLEALGESALLEAPNIRSTILKVPHHGSHTSSSEEFVDAVHPRIAVMSLGYRNRFHFPAPEVVDRYMKDGARIFRTDDDGAIEMTATRKSVALRTYRGGALRNP